MSHKAWISAASSALKRGKRTGQYRTGKVTKGLYLTCLGRSLRWSKNCLVNDVLDVITCGKFQNEIFMGYNFTAVEFPIFLSVFEWPYNSAIWQAVFTFNPHFQRYLQLIADIFWYFSDIWNYITDILKKWNWCILFQISVIHFQISEIKLQTSLIIIQISANDLQYKYLQLVTDIFIWHTHSFSFSTVTMA